MTATRWLLVGLCAAAAVLGGATLYELRSNSEPLPGASPAPAHTTSSGTSRLPADAASTGATIRNDDPSPAPGVLSVEQVAPPPPVPFAPPPAPAEPPNPATHRPPVDNPGDVDGDRPPRQVPGVE